jgi:hypothetical protein
MRDKGRYCFYQFYSVDNTSSVLTEEGSEKHMPWSLLRFTSRSPTLPQMTLLHLTLSLFSCCQSSLPFLVFNLDCLITQVTLSIPFHSNHPWNHKHLQSPTLAINIDIISWLVVHIHERHWYTLVLDVFARVFIMFPSFRNDKHWKGSGSFPPIWLILMDFQKLFQTG